MANVLNRTTKRYLKSVNTPDYSTDDWIINPDVSAMSGYTSKYWNISGDTVTLMNETERNEVDVQEEIKYYLFYDFFNTQAINVNIYEAPLDINYDIIGLHKKRYFNKGELYKVEYYGSYDYTGNTYSELVVHEERTFYRINEMVYKRELDICWHLNDGTSGATKQTEKFYTQEESFAAGERRRRNCITNLKINAVGLIMAVSGITQLEAEAVGWSFLGEFSGEITVYIEGAQQILLDAITNTTNHDWLDGTPAMLGGATVRQYILSQLTIDYTENNTYV